MDIDYFMNLSLSFLGTTVELACGINLCWWSQHIEGA